MHFRVSVSLEFYIQIKKKTQREVSNTYSSEPYEWGKRKRTIHLYAPKDTRGAL